MQVSPLSEKVGNVKSAAGPLIIESASADERLEDEVAMVVDFEVDSKLINPMESLSVSKGMNEADEKRILETIESLQDATLPSWDVPERIIIVVDRAEDDEEELPFEMTSGKKYSAFEIQKNAVTMFVHNKTSINKKHQFALMFLNEDCAEWVLDFQKSPTAIVNALNVVEPCKTKEFLTLDPIFRSIEKKTTLFQVPLDEQCIAPPYLVRVVFMFTRSKCLPILDKTKLTHILKSPYFYFDVIMSHCAPSEDNQSEQYFKYLTSIDPKGNSYKYSVGRNAKELHQAAAKLLAHPLQRPNQSEANYCVPKTEENVN